MLIVDDANPVFAAPKAWKVREAFEKAPFIVSFASFVDETSVLADLDPSGLLVPRVVVGCAARIRIDGRGRQRGARRR